MFLKFIVIISFAFSPCFPWKSALKRKFWSACLNVQDTSHTAVTGEDENSMGNEMADKLDVLMESLFNYVHDVTCINGKKSWSRSRHFINLMWDSHLSFANLHGSCYQERGLRGKKCQEKIIVENS